MRKFLFAAAVTLTALTATPALAQRYDPPPPPPEQGYYEGGDTGHGYDQGGYDEDGYSQGYDQRGYSRGGHRYQPGDYYEGDGQPMADNGRGYYRDNNYRDGRRYRSRRCGSTGTILGGIAGALIGGEVGRGGGRYSRRSGTGTVIGAGVGALIGNGIDQDNCDRQRGYRR
jgi:hypothetical protein